MVRFAVYAEMSVSLLKDYSIHNENSFFYLPI